MFENFFDDSSFKPNTNNNSFSKGNNYFMDDQYEDVEDIFDSFFDDSSFQSKGENAYTFKSTFSEPKRTFNRTSKDSFTSKSSGSREYDKNKFDKKTTAGD